MDNNEANNKKIAKNTLIVYSRLFIAMFVGLLTSRFVLQALGASDFGLYNVVGGVIAMFTFISGSLATTTTRFINYEMGKVDGNINKIFNISNTLHIFFAIIILLLTEIIGVFYINNYLNVVPGKEADAMFVFQVSTIVACIGIINIPYQSLFIANEKFGTIAIIDIINTLIKLILALVLLIYKGNALRFYAVCMSLTTLFLFVSYHYLCYKYWSKEVKWNFVSKLKPYKELLIFNNYNLLATGSIIARSQGSNILINYFFGTTVNAAYAIGNSVQHYVNIFIGNFDTATAPQITQNLANGNIERSLYLVNKTCRICILLMEIVFFTLIVELDLILHLWLENSIPDGTYTFCKYTLLIAVVSSTSGGLGQFINGSGKIKWFKIEMSVLYFSCLIFGYIAFKFGFPAYTIIILFVVTDVIHRSIQLFLLKVLMSFNIIRFIKEAYYRPFITFIILLAYVKMYGVLNISNIPYKFIGIFVTLLISSCIVYYFGLYKSERNKLILLVKNKIS